MYFKHYKEYEKNLKTDLLISMYCPYSRKEILAAIEIIIENNKSTEWLFEVLTTTTSEKGDIIKIVKKAVNSSK